MTTITKATILFSLGIELEIQNPPDKALSEQHNVDNRRLIRTRHYQRVYFTDAVARQSAVWREQQRSGMVAPLT